jgi:RimJ/RimL family protein N-acetyltransferase
MVRQCARVLARAYDGAMPPEPAAAPPERVEAGRVVLRRVQTSDAGAIAAAVSSSLDHLKPWMPWATREAAERGNQLVRVEEADHGWESGLGYIYSVLTADHGTLVGEIAMHRRDGDRSVELGYWIAAGQARRGYATLAAEAMTSVALALPGIIRVEIHCDAANLASAAVARKLGYRLDRIEERRPEAPGETGRLMVWTRERQRADR